jgi:hypothetical protein
MDQPPPKRRGLRFLIALVLVLALFGLGHWYWGVRGAGRFQRTIEKLKARGEPVTLADFNDPPVPDDQNAALDLRAAARSMKVNSPAWKAFEQLEEYRLPFTDEERSATLKVLAENPAALEKLHDARSKKDAAWGIRFTTPLISILLPDLNEQRELANLAAARAMMSHDTGDDAAAVETLRDILAQSRAVDRQPVLVGHLVALGISALATDRIGQISADLKVGDRDGAATREQVRALIDDLLEEKSLLERQKWALRGERMMFIDTVEAIRTGQLSPAAVIGSANPAIRPGPGMQVLAYVMRPKLLADADLLPTYTTDLIDAMDVSPDFAAFDARRKASSAGNEILSNPKSHILPGLLTPAYENALRRHYRILAERRMAATALGTRLYAAGHGGKLPETLDQLVPEYLPQVPRDPFAAGGQRPIGYSPDPKRPLIYSVGSNGADEGGSETSTVQHRDPGRWDRQDAIFDLRRPARVIKPADTQPAGTATP